MYSEKLTDLLESKDVSQGDKIRITLSDEKGVREGVLMPRTKQGDKSCIVLKMESGYNISYRYERIEDVEVISRKEKDFDKDSKKPGRNEENPDVLVLHTGGTIASRVSYEEGGVKPAFGADDLLQMYPEMFERANIDSEVVSQMLSEDMEPEHWQKIARKVFDNIEKYDGIIIGHGTDTMQYTASALSFMLENLKIPVVLVGAQRSSDRPSTDAAVNLKSALEFIEEDVPGVYVCMHYSSSDDKVAVHRGTRVRKMHTSRRDAFRTVGSRPFALVDAENGEVEFNKDNEYPVSETVLRDGIETDVGFLKVVPGMDKKVLEYYSGYKGVVIEGTGLGHMPVNSFDEHTTHHEKILEDVRDISDGSMVAMTSQCIFGKVNMDVYDAGVKISEADVVSAGSMLPGTAYVKMMWALGNSDSQEEAERLFMENVSGEFIEREDVDGFF